MYMFLLLASADDDANCCDANIEDSAFGITRLPKNNQWKMNKPIWILLGKSTSFFDSQQRLHVHQVSPC